jgi:membrane fusion protein
MRSMSDLFRPEAVSHQRRRLDGSVVLSSPASTVVLGGLLVVVICGATVFAATASYARRESVPGWIVPDRGLIRVTAREGGIVEALRVTEGSEVRAGDSLATVRLSADVAGGDAGASLMRDMTAEGEANLATARAGREKIASHSAEMTGTRAVLMQELAETRARVDVLVQKQQIAETQVSRVEPLLTRGFYSAAAMDQLKLAVLTAAQDASATRSQALDLQRQIDDIDHQRAGLAADAATVDAQAEQSQAVLSQRQVAAEAQATQVATAPVPGRVVAIPVERGQAIASGGAIAVITPEGSQLTAELYAPSRAAGFIKVGQQVRLMYQPFPYQTFGTGRGVVSSISRTVLAPGEVAIPGLSVKEPVFRVRVTLERADVAAYGRAVPLQPGMLLSADIVIDRRSLLQWILDPLYAVGRRP